MSVIHKSFLFLLFCLSLLTVDIYAQNDDGDFVQDGPLKVAVFDPASKVEEAICQIVREEISSVLVNSKNFIVLERQLINKVLEENKFQGEGLVDESQLSEIGKILGADYVFISTITQLSDNYYLSCKMIEVTTARIEKQFTGMTINGVIEIPQTTQFVVKRLLGEDVKQQTVDAPNNKRLKLPVLFPKRNKKDTSASKQTVETESQNQYDDEDAEPLSTKENEEPSNRRNLFKDDVYSKNNKEEKK